MRRLPPVTEAPDEAAPLLGRKVSEALRLPNGARYYRCALQVNPYAYLERHGKPLPAPTEDEYNRMMVDQCLETGIEVIAVTDHFSVECSGSLVKAARDKGIHAFTGFEAGSKEGVHFLCLFDQDKEDQLDRILGLVLGTSGIARGSKQVSTGSHDALELMQVVREVNGISIAAHVTQKKGLLTVLEGEARINAWKSPHLLACAIPGSVSGTPVGIRKILTNSNSDYRRDQLPALLNASDASCPDDLAKPGASCLVKMSNVSTEGLLQAFLDPGSRVRLSSDQREEPHAEILTMSWEGGFLDGASVHFNKNLNVLVGGRGAGKSTVIESLRYALNLGTKGKEADTAHKGIVRNVLQPATKISVLIQSHSPARRRYLIERTVPNLPVVIDEDGEVLSVSPLDLIPDMELYGQHEISELSKSREKQTLLLDRFMEKDVSLSDRKTKIAAELRLSRERLSNSTAMLADVEERLVALPILEDREKRYKQAGLEDSFKEKSLLVKEEQLFVELEERMGHYAELQENLAESLPVDSVFVSERALRGLPNQDELQAIEQTLEAMSKGLERVNTQFKKVLAETRAAVGNARKHWETKKRIIEKSYENLLRELDQGSVDAEQFIVLRKQIEELRALRARQESLGADRNVHVSERRKLLAEFEDVKSEEFRNLKQAAESVSGHLRDKVEVSVTMAGNRDPFFQMLRDSIEGNISSVQNRMGSLDVELSLSEFAECCRKGKDALIEGYGIAPGAAEKIASADPGLFMMIEELELPATTEIRLNTAQDGQHPRWQSLDELSTGQKATAILLLLLLESEGPLIVDQPEDDLDNRFVSDSVVPIMRSEKQRRQFIFSTHNANIPVLGDAEMIIGLDATGEAGTGSSGMNKMHMGSIDVRPVRELVEEILEGGKEAFEVRRKKYGF